MSEPIVIYGAGGLAREVEWLIRRINQECSRWKFEGYVVTDKKSLSEIDSLDQIVGDEKWLIGQKDLSIALAVGTPKHRINIANRLVQHFSEKKFPALVDPSAIYDSHSCKFETGAIITAGCVFTVNITLKRFSLVNLDCTIGHESVVGMACVLNPSVNISGGVKIGYGTLIGTGAQVLQYVHVGNGATVGAGAVVTKHVEDGQVVVGIPAKAINKGIK